MGQAGIFVMIKLVVPLHLIAISQPTQVPGNDSQCYFDFFKGVFDAKSLWITNIRTCNVLQA